tara:strand:- start:1912 stop:2532 length:621 start_codon:yes stop_codon:yes gene_type:complete
MSQKRISAELKNFFSHPLATKFYLEYYYIESYPNYINDNLSLILYEKQNHENNNNILIKIPNQYPFKPPTIYLKNYLHNNFDINYSRWAFQSGEKSNQIFKSLNLNSYDIFLIWFFVFNKNIFYLNKIPNYSINPNQECFCCSSVICPDNWSPAFKLSDVFLEYYLRKQFFNLSKPLGIKYIKSLFNNDKWDLSEDIVECILEKLF